MKFLIVVLAVVGGLWLLRNGRRPDDARPTRPSDRATPPAAPQEMTRCAVCGLHLPQSEAVAGQRGAYCSVAHRQQAED